MKGERIRIDGRKRGVGWDISPLNPFLPPFTRFVSLHFVVIKKLFNCKQIDLFSAGDPLRLGSMLNWWLRGPSLNKEFFHPNGLLESVCLNKGSL